MVHHDDREALGRSLPLLPGVPVVVGRDSPVLGPGTLADRLLSRRHAEVDLRPDHVLLVRDLGSLNGTTVNGARVEQATVQLGDVVGVGRILLLFHEKWPAVSGGASLPGFVGQSSALAQTMSEIRQVAARPTTVLVVGETGAGKELVARALHQESGRKGEFVAVNCGAFGEGVLASELFGHARGAFSGANTRRAGLVAAAEGGTLLLDEIGDAPPKLQVSLLRLLQEGEYRPVGSDHTVRADVRFVAATHRPLQQDVVAGSFRRDLYARLARWLIRVPPLRERREDLPILFDHFASKHGRVPPLSRDLATWLLRHDWPGNVRELAALAERLMVGVGDADKLVVPRWLDDVLVSSAGGADSPADSTTADSAESVRTKPKKRREKPSRSELLAALDTHGGNMRALARTLGVGRTTLYRWFRDYGMDPGAARSTKS